jgi:hypothetical protein
MAFLTRWDEQAHDAEPRWCWYPQCGVEATGESCCQNTIGRLGDDLGCIGRVDGNLFQRCACGSTGRSRKPASEGIIPGQRAVLPGKHGCSGVARDHFAQMDRHHQRTAHPHVPEIQGIGSDIGAAG